MLPVLRPESRPRFRRGPVSGETSQPSRYALLSSGRTWPSWVGAGSSSWVARPAIALRTRGVRRGGMATAWFALGQGACRHRSAPAALAVDQEEVANGLAESRREGGRDAMRLRIRGTARLRQD